MVDQAQAVQSPQRTDSVLVRDCLERRAVAALGAGRVPLSGQVVEGRLTGQDGLRDSVGGQHGDEFKHGTGQPHRTKQIGAVQGQGPGCGHCGSLLVWQGTGFGQQVMQLSGATAEEATVGGAVQVGVGKVGSGLGQSQWQIAQFFGQSGELFGGLVAADGGQGGGEVGDGLVRAEQTHLDQAAAPGPGGVAAAGGDQGPAVGIGGRPQTVQVVGFGNVVQHDQPAAPSGAGFGLQPGQESPCGPLRIGEIGPQDVGSGLSVGVEDGLAGGGGGPHQQLHLVVLPGVAGMVRGELGFTDPTHPGQDLAQHRRTPTLHRLPQRRHCSTFLEAAGSRRQDPDLVGKGRRGPRGGVVVADGDAVVLGVD